MRLHVFWEGAGLAALALLGGGGPLYYPLLFFLALYLSFRAARARLLPLMAGLVAGAGLANLAFYFSSGTLWLWEAVDVLVVAVAVKAAFHLFSWGHLFATYYRSPLAWLTTLTWAVLWGLLMRYGGAGGVAVMLFPACWLCFLPLWAPSWRVLHTLLYTAVYLLVQYPPAAGWASVASAFGFAFLPHILGHLYPERRHPLDSLPVITPTLTLGEKLKAWRDVFFLLGDYYALAAEKSTWFLRLAPAGRWLFAAGILGEFLASLAGYSPAWMRWAPVLLALAGLGLELGLGNYALVIIGLGLYGAALALGRGLLGGEVRYFPLVLGASLTLLAAALWAGRPQETRRDLERWKELSS